MTGPSSSNIHNTFSHIMESIFKKDYDLTPYTTFGSPARAKLFAEYSSVKELTKISRTAEFTDNEILHIGGGSNLLFVSDFDGLVLHSAIKGITRYDRDPETAYVIAGAGERWTDLVDWCVAQGLAGLENLAGIPGEVGAAPVQNVGAYGVEVKDTLHSVECFDIEKRETVTFMASECRLGYRDSIFKHGAKGRYYVVRVSFRLHPSTTASNLSYGPLRELHTRLGHTPTIEEVKKEVERIRADKLPDPEIIGSAGSFFKNPVVSRAYYEGEVLRRRPDTPCYELSNDLVKLPAAWMIDHAGLKGVSEGGARVWDMQPLVIVNSGSATASDVCRLANKIEETVNSKFGIRLHPEVNYIDTRIRVTVLGSSTSKGIPEIGCGCDVCRSTDRHDKRQRASIYVETHGLRLLIDASPDFRKQALENNITGIDAVLVTHNHADHVGGFDDLRPFCIEGDLPVFLREDVAASLRKRYDYCFRENLYPGVPRFDFQIIDDHPFLLRGLKIIPISVNHGQLPIVGYRIGDFAYITDAKTIPDSEMCKLEGLKVLIINGLRDREHFAHLTIDEALCVIKRLRPQQAWLTHLCHEAPSHARLSERLETACTQIEGVTLIQPAYDGQIIEC